jgi:large subunit ribosomal protein L25
MANIPLRAEPRALRGKKVAQLRRMGKIPANIYGHNVAPTAVSINTTTFTRLHPKLAPTTILQLHLPDEEPRPVMVKRASHDPRSGRILHVQFYQVNLHEKITATIPIVATGQPEAVAQGSGLLLQALDAVEVEALPMDLPPDIAVDVSGLHDSHEGIYVRDLPIDRDKITIKTHEDELVFKIAAPQAAPEDEVVPAAEAAEAAAPEEAGEGEAGAAEE